MSSTPDGEPGRAQGKHQNTFRISEGAAAVFQTRNHFLLLRGTLTGGHLKKACQCLRGGLPKPWRDKCPVSILGHTGSALKGSLLGAGEKLEGEPKPHL